MDAVVSTPSLRVALIGVPNCGKTALFNRLTGSRQKVANYPGVTVERREGERAALDGRVLRILDLPGTYSLSPTTLDEAITRDVLLGRVADAPAPELVVCVVDAVHLPIGLRLALEVKRLGLPMVLALNRMDVAKKRGVHIDVSRLATELGVPVLPTIAVKRGGDNKRCIPWLFKIKKILMQSRITTRRAGAGADQHGLAASPERPPFWGFSPWRPSPTGLIVAASSCRPQ